MIFTRSSNKDVCKIMQGPLADRISSGSSQHLLTRTATRLRPKSSYIKDLQECTMKLLQGRHRTREPAQSKCTWTSQKEPFSYARIYNENAAGQGRGNRLCKPPQPKCIRRSRLCDNVQMKMPQTKALTTPRRRLCASLRSRNAHGYCTRALHTRIYSKCAASQSVP